MPESSDTSSSAFTKAEQQAITDLQDAFGHVFTKPARLLLALTHSSAGESALRRGRKNADQSENYERLEFLGDRVVNLIVADLLFKAFPHDSEGDLARRHTAFVRGEALAKAARALEVQKYVRLSASEKASGGADNDNILADVMEALIAALYLDGGYIKAYDVVKQTIESDITAMSAPPIDPKTALQEWTQARKLGLPQYKAEGRSGPDHAPEFTVSVTVAAYKDRPAVTAQGIGSSKRLAEKAAAEAMMAVLEDADS